MAYSNSSRALAFLTETSEDAIAALKGIVGGAGSAKYLDTSEDKVSLITSQIDSSRDEDRIHGLTRIVAMISKGRDASSFLPGVLKLTSSTNMDVRKLVYIILLRYGNSNPDLTLLSINSFQRDLSDPSPLIRAMALRVLSAIKVKMVSAIVLMAVSKATRDPNLYVRKIAALAVPKCFELDRTQLPSLLESLSTLLSDRSPFVLGAALAAFQEMCPDRWDLLHPHYRKICHALADVDEWGQITCLEVLMRYSRANFVQPTVASLASPGQGQEAQVEASGQASSGSGREKTGATAARSETRAAAPASAPKAMHSALESFLEGEEGPRTDAIGTASPSSGEKPSSSSSTSASASIDRDLELLLVKAEPLLQNRNPAVVMAAARLIYYLAPASRHHVLARPIVRLVSRSTPDVVYLVLLSALDIARSSPELFAPYATAFFLGPAHVEPAHVSLLKLDMLTVVCNRVNVALALPELAEHVRSPSDLIATHAVGCLGRLAAKLPDACRDRCLAALLDLLKQKQRREGAIKASARDAVVAKAVLIIKDLVHDQRQEGGAGSAAGGETTASIVLRLASLLFGAPPKPSASATEASAGAAARKKRPKVVGKGAILHPGARASILWLLGQDCREVVPQPSSALGAGKTLAELVLPDILRRCAINFANEASIVKLQILTVSTKVFAFLPSAVAASEDAAQLIEAVTKVHFYLLRLARYDLDFDVRDRARLCKGLTAGLVDVPATSSPSPSQHADDGRDGGIAREILDAVRRATQAVGEWSEEGDANLKGVRLRREQVVHILFEGKSIPSDLADQLEADRKREPDSIGGSGGGTALASKLGSLSLALDGKLIRGWHATALPPWSTPEDATPASKRDPPPLPSTAPSGGLSAGGGAGTGGKVVLVPLESTRSSPVPSNREGKSSSTAGGATTKGRYKDLDAFLDESSDDEDAETESESDFEVDRAAREDSEFGGEESDSGQDAEDESDAESVDDDDHDDDDDDDDDEEEEEGTSAWKS
ncbi:uncharacterized protein PFL1_05524 [Pseudozyma flocculosa PF-1]|uniref:Clathrin/coatomer adaptor adaptin-like N-terminal domain-containing protein n=1 Tax=Pseudozyma flocculosa PF-1 TaxID=1277687 RepID=A0A061H3H7_9BASI|nr:uncharacterized protein PFL1_05524 [Pseudozyma flocculosa PF-1]EPQ26889.1 hypothetical protein PFL1_05524 [Pseudozyma flocculosa PF-1]